MEAKEIEVEKMRGLEDGMKGLRPLEAKKLKAESSRLKAKLATPAKSAALFFEIERGRQTYTDIKNWWQDGRIEG